MRRALAALLLAACAADPPARESEPLFGRASVLWPIVAGRATVRVCWLPPDLGGETFQVADFAPDLVATLAERKEWARAAVESEWNARTPMDFEGWGDCDVMPGDVKLQPISSATDPSCGGRGQACADALGADLRTQGAVHLNMLFGDEVLYSSRYREATAAGGYQRSKDVDGWWLPQACLTTLGAPWNDIFDDTVLAQFLAIYESCLQFNVLHEFGHAAGLAHEQYRRDDGPADKACYAYEASLGLSDIRPTDVGARYRGTLALGPFDSESIMSYCRTDPSPTLSPKDVELLPVLYGLAPDPYPPVVEPAFDDGCAVGHGGGGAPWMLLGLLLAIRRRGTAGSRSSARARRRRSCSPRSRCRSRCA